MPRRDPEKAVLMLDMLLEFFGEVGHRWAAEIRHDDFGGQCLLDVMAHLRRVMDFHGDPTRCYLNRAMPLPGQPIEDFNDWALCYDEIRDVILRRHWWRCAVPVGLSDRGGQVLFCDR